MALSDILNAIINEATEKIAVERTSMQKRLLALKQNLNEKLNEKKKAISESCDKKKQQLKAKTLAHADMEQRGQELSLKQNLLNSFFITLLETISNLPDNKIKPLLEKCLAKIKTNGVIHSSKKDEKILSKMIENTNLKMGTGIDAKGGFIFISPILEYNFTLENMISELKNKTEVDISQKLFS